MLTAASPESFPATLRAHRLAAGLTQATLAERASLSVRAIQNLERGERRPYAETAARLAGALDLHGDERARFEDAGRPRPRERRESGDVAALPDVSPAATNLPAPLTACIGRDRERAALSQALRAARLVTIVGPGGSGKTRLSLQVADDLIREPSGPAHVADGVLFVELDAVDDTAGVPHALARVLGRHERAGQPIEATLIEAVGQRHLLLLVDNCEHLVTGCAALFETLLSGCPDLRILATSRQPIGLAGETVYTLHPLAVPPVDVEAAGVESYPSVRLFVERARAAVSDFACGPREARVVARICRQLDGVPLALELAAARLRALSLDDLAARLDRPLALLQGAACRRPRQQSLRGAIDWSYALLDDSQRRLLGHLAGFSGPWTLDAVKAEFGREAVLGLSQLVDHSLVAIDRRDGQAVRYWMLEVVRQYALERQGSSGSSGGSSCRPPRHALVA